MAAFTITTGTAASPTNIDTLVGRTGGDTFAINGGFLYIDEDSRYGLNANTSATMASITPSATLGGSVLIDGRYIWMIPYTGGSGNVPAYNTAIGTAGGATGKLIGVHSALNAAPTTPGTAMPATGYIRVKQWNGTLYGTGTTLTGITATSAAGENVGWIVPVGQEGSLALVSSLNQTASGNYDGSFIKGDWFKVGTTDGNRATTYQIPTNGETVYHGAVMVDKAAATTITAATWSGGVATFTSTAHGLSTDDRVFVGGDILPRTWRTVDTQRCTVIDANTFTVPMTTNPGTYTSGGTVAAQEWWTLTDSVNTKVGPEDYRGKHCWLDSATGLLRFGNDGTTSTGGACPSSGRVIRLPNVMTAAATSAAKTVNALNAAVASRYRYYNGNAGVIKADHHSGSWSPSVFQTGKYVTMSDCAVVNQISVATQAAPCTFTNVAVGGNGNTTTAQTLVVTVPSGATFLDCAFSPGELGARTGVSLSTAYGVSFDRCKFGGTGDRSSASYTINANIGNGATFTRCAFGGQGLLTSSQFSNGSMTNCTYYAATYGIAPVTTNPTSLANLSNISTDWTFDTFTFLGTVPLQRTSLVTAVSSSDRLTVRNMGTYASPVDTRLNGTNLAAAWTRVTTTATVTENGHPYRVGDQVVVFAASNTTTITLVTKTITAITTNTFNFACANSGPTSGTLSYYVGGISALFSLNSVANVKIQNVHVRGNFGAPFSTNNNQYGLVMENVSSDPQIYNVPFVTNANNTTARSVYADDYPIIAGPTAVFGSHFQDMFQREPGTAVPGQSAAVTGCSWTRSGTTCTVTSTAHGITGAAQRIWVENSSSQAAVANGWGASAFTLVPLDANTFTFTCVNAGATSGTLDYRLFGDSVFRTAMNEQTSATTGQAQVTVAAGTAGFTGAGTGTIPAVGDQLTWETPAFIKGYDGFGYPPAIIYGTGLTTAAGMAQIDLEYALDRGSGFGAWRNAAYQGSAAGGWGASGSTQVTVTNSTGIQSGDYCMGVGIASGAQFVSRQPGKLTMTNAATSTASSPDSTALQLTSSCTLDAKLTLANWSTGMASGCIIAKGDSSSLTKGYYLRFQVNGGLTFAIGTGSAAVSVNSSASTSTVFTNGQPGWVRVQWDQAASQCKFYTSPDGTTWTQLGTTQTLTAASIATSASTFFIGQRTTGNDFLAADIYRVRVYSDATQTTKVADWDAANNTTGVANLTDSVNGAILTTVGCQEVTLSAANTAAVSGILTWWYQPNETAFPAAGVKYKVRATANTAQTAAAYQIDLPLLSSNTSRARLYPQTVSAPLSITAVDSTLTPIQNARVYIKAAAGGPETTGTVLLTGVTNASGVLTGTYGYSSSQPITGWVRKSTGSPTYKQALVAGTIGSTGYSTTVFLVKDE